MKVVLINGSPHAQGCTYTALCEIKKTLEQKNIEAKIIHIGVKPIGGCLGCGACSKLGKCVQDDIVNEVAEEIKSADGYIFGSPVHYASAGGAMTSFMDRIFCSCGKYMAYKPAASICSARRGGTTSTYDQLNKYIGINNMIMVPAPYWNMVHGSCPEDVLKDEEGLRNMRMIGDSMAWILHLIELGKENHVVHPIPEDVIRTNFIR